MTEAIVVSEPIHPSVIDNGAGDDDSNNALRRGPFARAFEASLNDPQVAADEPRPPPPPAACTFTCVNPMLGGNYMSMGKLMRQTTPTTHPSRPLGELLEEASTGSESENFP